MDDDVEPSAAVDEFARLTGSSSADQLSAELRDLADAVANFRDRLIDRGFPDGSATDMVAVWFNAFVWQSDDEDE